MPPKPANDFFSDRARRDAQPVLDQLETLLHRRGSGGTSGGVNDDWKESVDRQLGQLHGDVRTMLKAGLAASLLMLSAIGGLYVRTDSKFEAVNGRFDALNERIGRVEQQQARIEAKLDLLIQRLPSPRN